MKPSDLILLSATALSLIILALIFNSVGVYLLLHVKKRRTHQNVILINLSVAEIFISVISLIFHALVVDGFENHLSFWSICFIIGNGVFLAYYLIMMVITLDRLAMSILTMRYRIILTHSKILLILACCWISGFGYSLLVYFLNIQNSGLKIMEFTTNWGFLVIAISTYAFILCKLIRRRRHLHQDQNESPQVENFSRKSKQQSDLNKFYFTSGLIILSFVISVNIPNVIREFSSQSVYVIPVINVIRYLNFVVDPCIYTFLQKDVRNLLKQKLSINSTSASITIQ